MTAERRAALLAYCRIDELAPEEEGLLEVLYGSAVTYLEQAGVSEPRSGTGRRAQYELCVNYLVLDGWDRRETAAAGTGFAENPAFRRLLNQLKLTEAENLSKLEPVEITHTDDDDDEAWYWMKYLDDDEVEALRRTALSRATSAGVSDSDTPGGSG